MHARATIRAWGREEVEARANLDRVRIAAGLEDGALVLRVDPQAQGAPRRIRVDLDLRVPPGVHVEITQAKGDVEAAGLGGDLAAHLTHGDVAVRDHGGAAVVKCKHGDLNAARVQGSLDLRTLKGDIVLEAVGGAITAHSKSGDVTLRRPSAPVRLDCETGSGSVEVEVDQFVGGSTSRLATMSGELTVRLGPRAGCRIDARVTAGEIHVAVPLAEAVRGRQSLEGVVGPADAALHLSAMSGEITIAGLDW